MLDLCVLIVLMLSESSSAISVSLAPLMMRLKMPYSRSVGQSGVGKVVGVAYRVGGEQLAHLLAEINTATSHFAHGLQEQLGLCLF